MSFSDDYIPNDYYRDFYDFSYCVSSNNEVTCDGPLYQFLECYGESYSENIYGNKLDELIIKAIQNSDIETLRLMDVPRYYFYYVCKFNNVEILEMFISKYINLNMDLALEFGCIYRNSNVVKISLLNGADIHKHGDKAIILAVMNNSFEIVKILIENKANIHTFNDMSFVLACENGNIDIVKLLVENGADINSSGEYEYEGEGTEKETGIKRDEGFRLACKNGHFEVIKLLLDLGINVNAGFNYSCMKGDIDIVKFLISKEADISKALRYASSSNNLDLVKYLINIGCKIDLENGKDLRYARNIDIINFLLENGASPKAETIGDQFYYYSYDNNIAEILLKNYKRNETFDRQMETLISRCNLDTLRLLFKYVNLDCTNALEYAIYISRNDVCFNQCIDILKDQCTRFNSI
jgi:ankyrin repeat protein